MYGAEHSFEEPAMASTTTHELSEMRRLFEEHASYIRDFAAHLGGWGVEPDDIVQNVFLVAWRKRERLTAGPVRSWLCGIAVREVQAARRRAKLRRFFALDEATGPTEERTPARLFEQAEASQLVYAALDKVASKKRTVFVMYELQGLSGEEIAQIVGCPLKTVWTRLFHARREFRAHLERHAASDRAARR
jgi:RNA polymerase sigma-70 factor, ECF subfamily